MHERHETAASMHPDGAPPEDTPDEAGGTARGVEASEVRSWPASYAVLTAWLRPATTTRRTAHVSLPRAFLVHLVAVALTVAILVYMATNLTQREPGLLSRLFPSQATSIALGEPGKLRPGTTFTSLGELLLDLHASFKESPTQAAVKAGIVLAVVEGGFLLLALIVLPFGARVERFGDSVRHALRRTWLHAGHLVPAIAIPWLAALAAEDHAVRWMDQRRADMRRELTPPSRPQRGASRAERDAYKEAQREYTDLQREMFYQPPRSWICDHRGELRAYLGIGCCVWFLWALFRGISAPRPLRAADMPTLCRACGYNLTGRETADRCPECGHARATVETMPAGIPWEARGSIGRRRAFWRTTLMGMLRPRRLAEGVRLEWGHADHLRFLAMHLALAVFAFWLPVAIGVTYKDMLNPKYPVAWAWSTVLIPIWACQVGVVLLILTSLVTLALGLNYRVRDRRNVLCGISPVACYAAGFLPLTAAAVGTAVTLFTVGEFYLGAFARLLTFQAQVPAGLTCVGILLVLVAVYSWQVRKGAKVIRFASV